MPGGEPLCRLLDLWVGSRRLPETAPDINLPRTGFERFAIVEMARQGQFPGAACCRPIELPSYKAAPLQARYNSLGPSSGSSSCKLEISGSDALPIIPCKSPYIPERPSTTVSICFSRAPQCLIYARFSLSSCSLMPTKVRNMAFTLSLNSGPVRYR